MVLNYQLSSPETMERAICELGIVPFFTSAIPGYSIKELTQPGFWFFGLTAKRIRSGRGTGRSTASKTAASPTGSSYAEEKLPSQWSHFSAN